MRLGNHCIEHWFMHENYVNKSSPEILKLWIALHCIDIPENKPVYDSLLVSKYQSLQHLTEPLLQDLLETRQHGYFRLHKGSLCSRINAAFQPTMM